MKTVREISKEYDKETTIKWADHRIECLEAEVRHLRQHLDALASDAIAGDPSMVRIARRAQSYLKTSSD